jgi:hypothetical protein
MDQAIGRRGELQQRIGQLADEKQPGKQQKVVRR